MGLRATAIILGGVALGFVALSKHKDPTPGGRLKTITAEEMAAHMPAQLVLEKGRRGYIIVSSCVSFRQVGLLNWLAHQSKKLLYFKQRDDSLDPCLLIEAGHLRDDGAVEITRIEAQYIAKYTKHYPAKVVTPSQQVAMALEFAVHGTALEPVELYSPTGG